MPQTQKSELLTAGSARCGRCAEILPDETLTYCLSCGVPFSKVPPTTSYTRFDERGFQFTGLKQRFRQYGLAIATFCAIFAFYGLVDAYRAGQVALLLKADRPLIFHVYNSEKYPKLDRKTARESVSIGLQAFEDHFGLELTQFDFSEEKLPEDLATIWKVAPPTQYTSWEKQIFPTFQKIWINQPSGPLHVILTNIPILADDDKSSLETRHLSDSKLISGLAHPGLVVVSSFRMLTTDPEYIASRFDVPRPGDKSRLMGEYLIAHELGHALLGLPDYIIEESGLRGPASAAVDPGECLMHTDAHGGFGAWEQLKKRKLGTPAPCVAYENVLQAFRLRRGAILALHAGNIVEARKQHKQAIDLARQELAPWVSANWISEHDAFLSFSERWMNRLLMTQLRND